MKFKINNDNWEIRESNTKDLIALYKSQNYEDDVYFALGVTIKPEHIIYINGEMNFEQQIKTLKHELTHCFIWEYALFNVPNFNEEMVCDLVSSINDFINEIVEKYRKENKR